MASANTLDRVGAALPTTVKLVISGGLGAGKTTLVGAISEIPPVDTDNWMTETSRAVDRLAEGEAKTTTTVAMDFGRITLGRDLVLYLFGTPGQPRFWPMWDDLCRGASGALVLVDTRSLDLSFPAINYFDTDSDLPFIVAVNLFDGVRTHPLDEVRRALRLPPHIPLTTCDARDRRSVATALIATAKHALRLTGQGASAYAGPPAAEPSSAQPPTAHPPSVRPPGAEAPSARPPAAEAASARPPGARSPMAQSPMSRSPHE
jgi:signal recognition particle receptor subunit beta